VNAPQDPPLAPAAALAHSARRTDRLRTAPNDELSAAVTRLGVAAETLKGLRNSVDDEGGDGTYWLTMNDAVHSLSCAIVALQELLDLATAGRT